MKGIGIFVLLFSLQTVTSFGLHINSAADFVSFANAVNNKANTNKTVFLDADIDFSEVSSDSFSPIGKNDISGWQKRIV